MGIATLQNGISGFSSTGIWPLNRNAVPNEAYGPSETTNRSFPPGNHGQPAASDLGPSTASHLGQPAASDPGPSTASHFSQPAASDPGPSTASHLGQPAASDPGPSTASHLGQPAASDTGPSTASGLGSGPSSTFGDIVPVPVISNDMLRRKRALNIFASGVAKH